MPDIPVIQIPPVFKIPIFIELIWSEDFLFTWDDATSLGRVIPTISLTRPVLNSFLDRLK